MATKEGKEEERQDLQPAKGGVATKEGHTMAKEEEEREEEKGGKKMKGMRLKTPSGVATTEEDGATGVEDSQGEERPGMT